MALPLCIYVLLANNNNNKKHNNKFLLQASLPLPKMVGCSTFMQSSSCDQQQQQKQQQQQHFLWFCKNLSPSEKWRCRSGSIGILHFKAQLRCNTVMLCLQWTTTITTTPTFDILVHAQNAQVLNCTFCTAPSHLCTALQKAYEL